MQVFFTFLFLSTGISKPSRPLNDPLHGEVNKYLPVRGHPDLRQAIAEWAVHHKGVSVTAEDVMVGPGSKQLIDLLLLGLQQ